MVIMAHDTAKLEAKLREVFETGVPFNSLLGLKVHSIDRAAPQLRFDMRPRTDRQSAPADPAWRRHFRRAGRRGGLCDPPCGRRQQGRGIGRAFPLDRHPSTCASTTCGPGRGNYFIATGRVVRARQTASPSPTWIWSTIPAN
jgi:hypothetical protein